MNPFLNLDSLILTLTGNDNILDEFPSMSSSGGSFTEETSSTTSTTEDLSESTNSDMNQTATEADLHPISCIRCRRMHKYCSKTLPACERCAARGVECIYREPKKVKNSRGHSPTSSTTKRKRDDPPVDDSHPATKHVIFSNSNETSMDEIRINSTIIEHYTPWYLSMPLPLNFFVTSDIRRDNNSNLNRDLFEKFFVMHESNDEAYMLERNAFYWSVQALLHQSCGELDLAEECGMKSRHLISKTFNPSLILVSYTYLNLGLLETGRGNIELSNFDLHCCKFGIQANISNDKMRNDNLARTVSFVEQFSLGEMDVLRFAGRLSSIFEFICGNTLTSQLVNLLQQNITKENCHDIINTGSEIIKLCITNIRDRSKNDEESSKHHHSGDGLEFTQQILIEGLKMGVFISSLSRTDLIEESSLRITYLCESVAFNHCSMFMIPFVAMATRVNMQVVKSISNGSRMNGQIGMGELGTLQPINYYEILQRNQRALNLLNSRFSLVSIVHGKLLRSIGELLTK